jgi:hypothetical protein
MSEEWKLFLNLGDLLAFVVFGVYRPRMAARLIQIALTVGVGAFALYGLGMTIFGETNSVLFTAGAVGLAFFSFHIFDWWIRSRFGE